MLQKLTLDNGYLVRCRPVPPHAGLTLYMQAKDRLPPTPEQPMMEAKSVAGHSEQVPAPKGGPEWEAYQLALAAWGTEAAKIQQDDRVRHTNFRLSYCIVDWKPPLSWSKRILRRLLGKDPWQAQPPKDWEFPSALIEYGVAIPSKRRIDFIHYELLATNRDVEAIMSISIGGADLTEEEVDAAADKFRSAMEQREPAVQTATDRDTGHHVSDGDGSS